jgi:hypothetical protein
MGKAFDHACPHRIGPTAYHNDGNPFRRINEWSDERVASRYDDEINLRTHQLLRKLLSPIAFPSVFGTRK